jgi:hypothetical protein
VIGIGCGPGPPVLPPPQPASAIAATPTDRINLVLAAGVNKAALLNARKT